MSLTASQHRRQIIDDWIILAAGAALLLVSLLPWQKTDVPGLAKNGNAWEIGSTTTVVPVVIGALMLLASIVVRARARTEHLRQAQLRWSATSILGVAAFLLAVQGLFKDGDVASYGRYLGVLCAAFLAYAALDSAIGAWRS